MRFKDFLQEASHREDISLERAEELLQAHCKDAIKHFDKPLWRGTRAAGEDAYLIQADKGSRKSRNSTNYYTIIMDHFLPDNGYPLRSASLICGNNENISHVRGYGTNGTVFALFPYNGVPIGVCEGEDMWDTMLKIGGARHFRSIVHWNGYFEDCGLPDSSYDDLIESIEKVLQNPEDPNFISVEDIFESRDPRVVLEQAYSDKNLGLKLATTANVYNIEGEHELWIGGKCVAIRDDVWEKMKDKFK